MSVSHDQDENEPATELLSQRAAESDAAGTLQPGARIAAYRLQRRLGAGGMGEVWLAEQLEPVRRPVALKLMQQRIASLAAEAHFEVERQALARMDHPAIAKVFDAGRSVEGHPWLVMEWVDGLPLDAWRQRQQPDPATRLRLLAALARGVQHAHGRGVLHRDLKPGNVLVVQVDGRPQPKLIDFGIAMGLGAGPGSESGTSSYSAAGSGAYMSPEQRAGEPAALDPRADVYALGMLLLGLLLPEPGLSLLGEDVQDAARLRQRIDRALAAGARGEPVLGALPRPLLQLLRCALAPAQDERYASAEVFALELERYLQHRPLAVMSTRRGHRLALFLRRNRLAVGAAAAISLALLGGLGAALYGLREARLEAERARTLSGFLGDVLNSVDPEVAADLDKALLKRILDAAAERAERELGTRPDVLAEVRGQIGMTLSNFGEAERGVALLRDALQGARRALGPGHALSLKLSRRLADALALTGAAAEAETLTREALLHAPVTLADDPLTWADLQLSLAWALRDQARFEEALVEAQAARARLQAVDLAPLGLQGDPDPLTAGYVVAVILSDLGRLGDALALLQPLHAARREFNGVDHPKTLRLANSLGVMLIQQRRFGEAIPVLEQVVAGYTQSHGPDHAATLSAVANLAGALRQNGDIEASAPHYQRAYRGLLDKFGEAHPRTLVARANLGNYQLSAGDARASLESHLRARELALSVLGAEHPLISETYFGAGKALAALGEREAAEQALQHALQMRQARLPPGHKSVVDVETELARVRGQNAGR